LQKAIAAGWRDRTKLQTDTDLDPIRSRPDFQPILLDTGFPRDPFARRPVYFGREPAGD
jgi:hypothetical protein